MNQYSNTIVVPRRSPQKMWSGVDLISSQVKKTCQQRFHCVRGTRFVLGFLCNIGCPVQLIREVFFEIAFVVVVDTHLPRFEALAYVLPHFDELTHVVIPASSSVC